MKKNKTKTKTTTTTTTKAKAKVNKAESKNINLDVKPEEHNEDLPATIPPNFSSKPPQPVDSTIKEDKECCEPKPAVARAKSSCCGGMVKLEKSQEAFPAKRPEIRLSQVNNDIKWPDDSSDDIKLPWALGWKIRFAIMKNKIKSLIGR